MFITEGVGHVIGNQECEVLRFLGRIDGVMVANELL
jgi:hypothetical protein